MLLMLLLLFLHVCIKTELTRKFYVARADGKRWGPRYTVRKGKGGAPSKRSICMPPTRHDTHTHHGFPTVVRICQTGTRMHASRFFSTVVRGGVVGVYMYHMYTRARNETRSGTTWARHTHPHRPATAPCVRNHPHPPPRAPAP